jgi:hypothetical protein
MRRIGILNAIHRFSQIRRPLIRSVLEGGPAAPHLRGIPAYNSVGWMLTNLPTSIRDEPDRLIRAGRRGRQSPCSGTRQRTQGLRGEGPGEVEGIVGRAAVSPPGSCPRGCGSPRTGLTLRPIWSRRRQVRALSFVPAVPPACHKQRSPAVSQRSITVTRRRPVGWAHRL